MCTSHCLQQVMAWDLFFSRYCGLPAGYINHLPSEYAKYPWKMASVNWEASENSALKEFWNNSSFSLLPFTGNTTALKEIRLCMAIFSIMLPIWSQVTSLTPRELRTPSARHFFSSFGAEQLGQKGWVLYSAGSGACLAVSPGPRKVVQRVRKEIALPKHLLRKQ